MGGERTDSGQHIQNGTVLEGRYTDSHDHKHSDGSGRDMVGRLVTYKNREESTTPAPTRSVTAAFRTSSSFLKLTSSNY